MVDFFKFTEQVNLLLILHPIALQAMKFTAEISDTETIFLDPVVYQGTTFRGTRRHFSENIRSEDDLRSRILGTFVVNSFLLACLS